LHALLNGPAVPYIKPNSILSSIRKAAIPLKIEERAQLLYDSEDLEREHMATAVKGDTVAPDAQTFKNGLHFLTFVRGDDGHLWELEGGRKGPLDRGLLGENEDALSKDALEKGLGRLVELEKNSGGDLRFSCIACCEGSDYK
jgi:ubiquitin carboxyl-terminal hydrolase L3